MAGNLSTLIGRGPELQAIADLYARLEDGSGGVLVLEGEPGIGKTALFDAALREAPPEVMLFKAVADPLDLERPFGVLLDALAAVETPELFTFQGDDQRLLFTEEVCRILQARSLEGPILLAIENLHWADVGSLTVLNALSKRASSFRLGVLVTARPTEPGTHSHTFVASQTARGSRVLSVNPLSSTETLEISAAILGGETGPRLRARLDSAGGNPLFVTELLAALSEDGALVSTGDAIELEREVSAPPLRMTILRRLNVLDEDAIEVLRCAAVLGGSFSTGLVGGVAGATDMEVLRRLERAEARGFLVSEGATWDFRHDVIREALYEDLPADLREKMHGDIARLLVRLEAPVSEVLHHLVNARFEASPELLALVRTAVPKISATSPEVAAVVLERCISALPEESTEREDALEELLVPLFRQNALDRAADVLDQLMSSNDVERVARVCAWRCRLAVLRERPADYAGAAAEGLALPGLKPETRAELLGRRVAGLIAFGDLPQAIELVSECLEVGERLGVPFATASGYFTLQIAAILQGRYREAGQHSDRTIAQLEDPRLKGIIPVESRSVLSALIMWACPGLIAADRLADAELTYRRAMTYSERSGELGLVEICHWGTALLRFQQGRWDDTLAELEAATRVEAGALIPLPKAAPSRVIFDDPSIQIHIERDDLSKAEAALEDMEKALQESAPGPGMIRVMTLRSHLAMARGQKEMGLSILGSMLDAATAMGFFLDPRGFGLHAVATALELGRGDEAERFVDAISAGAKEAGVGSMEALAAVCEAMAGKDVDRATDAIELTEDISRPFLKAEIREHAVPFLSQRGSHDAVEILEGSLQVYRDLQAVRAETRCLARLRSLGVKKGARGARGRPSTGWESLTPSERRVVSLLAEGPSNREIAERLFISARTVETHLSNAFRKLGVSSRTELAALVAKYP